MKDPRPGIIGRETNGNKVTFGITSINNISLDGIIKVELAAIGTSHDAEGVLYMLFFWG